MKKVQMLGKRLYNDLINIQCLGGFLGIIGQDRSVSKSNRSNVDILQFFFTNLRHIL